MTELRNKIAALIDQNLPEDYDAGFQAADAIIAALPDMVGPLVWVESEFFKSSSSGGYLLQHEHDASGAGFWAFGFSGTLISDHKTRASAIAAANAHNAAAVVSALTGDKP